MHLEAHALVRAGEGSILEQVLAAEGRPEPVEDPGERPRRGRLHVVAAGGRRESPPPRARAAPASRPPRAVPAASASSAFGRYAPDFSPTVNTRTPMRRAAPT